MKSTFAPICAWRARTIDEYDVTKSVTDQLWWRHDAKSEKTVLSDSGEMSDRWLVLAELCV